MTYYLCEAWTPRHDGDYPNCLIAVSRTATTIYAASGSEYDYRVSDDGSDDYCQEHDSYSVHGYDFEDGWLEVIGEIHDDNGMTLYPGEDDEDDDEIMRGVIADPPRWYPTLRNTLAIV